MSVDYELGGVSPPGGDDGGVPTDVCSYCGQECPYDMLIEDPIDGRPVCADCLEEII